MAKRFHDTEIYDKDWFIELKPVNKLLWEYITKKSNHAGIWDVNLAIAKRLIGLSEKIDLDDFVEECNADGKVRIIKIKGGKKIFITTTVEFQYQGKHDVCYLNPKEPVRKSIIELLNQHNETKVWLEEKIKSGVIVIGQMQENKHLTRSQLTTKVKGLILKIDDFTCQYCGSKEDLEVDHVVPIELGGTNDNDNLLTCCSSCNKSKGHQKSALEYSKELAVKPGKRLFGLLLKQHSKDNFLRGFLGAKDKDTDKDKAKDSNSILHSTLPIDSKKKKTKKEKSSEVKTKSVKMSKPPKFIDRYDQTYETRILNKYGQQAVTAYHLHLRSLGWRNEFSRTSGRRKWVPPG